MFLIYHWLLRDNFVNKDVDYTLRTVLILYFIDKHFTRTIIYIYITNIDFDRPKDSNNKQNVQMRQKQAKIYKKKKKIEYLQDLYGNSGKTLKN